MSEKRKFNPLLVTLCALIICFGFAGLVFLANDALSWNSVGASQVSPGNYRLELGQSTASNWWVFYYTGMSDTVFGTIVCHYKVGYGAVAFTISFKRGSVLWLDGTAYKVTGLTSQYVSLEAIN